MKKQAQVVMLATDKESKIQLTKNFLNYAVESFIPDSIHTKAQHLYILSDDKIEESDWKYCFNTQQVLQAHKLDKNNICKDCKKIIATTDKSLRYKSNSNGTTKLPLDFNIPQIPNQFIELFITEYNKGNIITEVEVEYLKPTHYDGEYFKDKLLLNQDNTINISLPVKNWLSNQQYGNTLKY